MLGLGGVALLVVYAWDAWQRSRVRLEFVGIGGVGAAIPALELTVFSDRLSFLEPSPSPALAVVDLDGSDAVTLDSSLVPQRAAVRYRGDGVGAGVIYVALGEGPAPIALEPPRRIEGRVVEPSGFWCFGWRSAAMRPVAGAEVLALAGGEQGVELERVRADTEGRFVLTGVAPSVHPLSLRVLADGHAIAHVEVPPAGAPDREVLAPMQRTTAITGRITSPADVDLTRLVVLARGLPGVQVVPAADGTFVLDHVPPRLLPRLLLHGLDRFHCSPEVRATRAGVVELEVGPAGVLRGSVTDAATGGRLAGAHVFTDSGAAAQSDAAGEFELVHVQPGRVSITAQYEPPRRPRQRRDPMRIGHRETELAAGQVVDGLDIVVTVKESR